VDGGLVRTLLYADALDSQNFPQTPMRIKIGNVSIKFLVPLPLLYCPAIPGLCFITFTLNLWREWLLICSQWDGGAADKSKGTVERAGGYTDLGDAPFIIYVKNITISDFTISGTTY
jgi:hypothetical protein